MSKIHLTINGRAVEADSGDTILVAARKADIRIPTLCYHPALPPKNPAASAWWRWSAGAGVHWWPPVFILPGKG